MEQTAVRHARFGALGKWRARGPGVPAPVPASPDAWGRRAPIMYVA